jgi:mono/diheme cytochrome c family protein
MAYKTQGIALVLLMLVAGMSIANHQNGHVDVTVDTDQLSDRALKGQEVFNIRCAVCHGTNGSGTPAGPPLIHTIYNPNHHDNNSFSRAVTKGVQQHHWSYGNMPAQAGVGFSELSAILAFVREVQVFNGVLPAAHSM